MNFLQIISQLQNAQNPMGMIQQIFGKNPQFQLVMNAMQGKTPQEFEQYVRNTAKTQGVDVNQLAKKLGLNINNNNNFPYKEKQ